MTAWVRGLVDVDPAWWAKSFIAAGNVPHSLYHGTWRKPIIPTYDVLMQVYGFDVFSNLRFGMGSSLGDKTAQQLKEKMNRKRYRITNTYGAYNRSGLQTYLEHETLRCPCPICDNQNPAHLYDRFPASDSGIESLRQALATHRVYTTHREMLELNSTIKQHRYDDHLSEKVEATNEIRQILRAVAR